MNEPSTKAVVPSPPPPADDPGAIEIASSVTTERADEITQRQTIEAKREIANEVLARLVPKP